MNKYLALMPITGLILLTLAGCATTPNGSNATHNAIINSSSSTSHSNTVSNSATPSNTTAPTTVSKGNSANSTHQNNGDSSENTNEIAVIQSRGYDVTGATPNASVQTNSGGMLTAWIGVAAKSDGHNQFVFFFLNGRYLGTDTAKPSAEISSVKPAASGSIAVTYPVYRVNDSFADPTGTPVTITYHWNGTKLTADKPYPKQFS